jgi:hypothetical protein
VQKNGRAYPGAHLPHHKALWRDQVHLQTEMLLHFSQNCVCRFDSLLCRILHARSHYLHQTAEKTRLNHLCYQFPHMGYGRLAWYVAIGFLFPFQLHPIPHLQPLWSKGDHYWWMWWGKSFWLGALHEDCSIGSLGAHLQQKTTHTTLRQRHPNFCSC